MMFSRGSLLRVLGLSPLAAVATRLLPVAPNAENLAEKVFPGESAIPEFVQYAVVRLQGFNPHGELQSIYLKTLEGEGHPVFAVAPAQWAAYVRTLPDFEQEVTEAPWLDRVQVTMWRVVEDVIQPVRIISRLHPDRLPLGWERDFTGILPYGEK